jgi:oligopeptide transport system permease protein
VAGYAGGRTDELMMRFVDVLYALPTIFLVILLLVFFSRSLLMLFVALGLVQWLTMARIVRGQVLSLKQQTFVEAARAMGAGARRVIFRHLVPNTLGPVVVYATLTVPAVILQEAFLSFLGLGVQPPAASWGTLIADGARVMALFPWLVLFPGLALSLTLLAFNFLGDGLRDALDPRA